MRLPKDYAAPRQEQTAVEYIWEQKGCVQQRREPIVRCRECEHYDSERYGCWWFAHAERQSDYSWADEPSDVEPDGFCAWGERKADA